MQNQYQFENQIVVITGAGNGIGRATAIMMAEAGAHVFAGDLNHLPENQETFSRLGITAVKCDVRQESDVQKLIEQAVQQHGRIDILVNNAGIGMVKPIHQVTEAEWDACIDTNLKGTFLGCKHAIRNMLATGGGTIVNTASNAGLLPRAHDPVYSISKHAVVALTESLGLCHGKDNIRINCVCPGPVGETGMMNADIASATDPEGLTQSMIRASPIAAANKRMISPREVASAICYLASKDAVMVTGTAIRIDGGKSLGVPPQGN
ncbi:SDR family oxidoreductase [Gimesia sp.]|uniref:SDR family NAD(P)-dependent oxidoreductase n=1 Tax=Gimesia sp. TaxID=2024833 RepID=UPI000C544E45|nr:SDR family oxidoreductase [Gimesia sp.]MAX35389.1 dehydrogenase [Gimesia sp.]HAH43467.1 dehydrogenase [Planctomycetaceae bacterium]HBL47059.1 dehydrogenase [Planctomycetaceae bacterium]|tara:strand:+ start:4670 stop:5464 length:795 start_codon:yes stop_codon:yes gene_type:complete